MDKWRVYLGGFAEAFTLYIFNNLKRDAYMTAYYVRNYTITNRPEVEKLDHEAGIEVIKKYGGKLLAASPVKALYDEAKQHLHIIEFKSVEEAEKYHNSLECREFIKVWKSITDGWCAIVPDVAGTELFVKEKGLF